MLMCYKIFSKGISAMKETLPFNGLLVKKHKTCIIKRGEIFLLDIFILSLNVPKVFQVSRMLGAPSFMRVDAKRWCQTSV